MKAVGLEPTTYGLKVCCERIAISPVNPCPNNDLHTNGEGVRDAAWRPAWCADDDLAFLIGAWAAVGCPDRATWEATKGRAA